MIDHENFRIIKKRPAHYELNILLLMTIHSCGFNRTPKMWRAAKTGISQHENSKVEVKDFFSDSISGVREK